MPFNTSVANEVWNRYIYLRDNGHVDFIQKARTCENFFAGMQWDKKDLSALHAQKRPALTINKIISTIANVLGEQIFSRTDISFKPRNEGATSDVADVLTKVFMQIADNNQLSWLRSDVFCDGVIASRGFFDVRLDFSDSLRGEVKIEQLNPKNVLIDADADEYDPDKWGDVCVSKWLSIDQIELLYGKKDADLLRNNYQDFSTYAYDWVDKERDRFGNSMNYPYSSTSLTGEANRNLRDIRVVERQWKKLDQVIHFVNLATGDMRPIPFDWEDDKIEQYLINNPDMATSKKLIHRIRWTTVAANVVLHDDWSPYKHFTVVPYFPYFRRGKTVGLVENLIGPQELLNKVSSQELHVVNTSANSGWKVRRSALQNMTVAELEQRGAQSGIVLELDELANADKIQPNQTPTGLDRISYKAEEHIKSISGVSDYMQGFAREDVSAKSVTANKQAGSANLAKVLDNLNRTDFILARNVLDLVQEFYTEERLLFITTDKMLNTTESMRVNEVTPEGQVLNDLTLGEYAVVVTSQPERDTFEETQFDQAIRLRIDAGVNIPDKYIIQSSRLKNKADIIAAIDGDKNSPEAQAAAELQQRTAQAEVSKLEAEAQQKNADAQLRIAKIQSEGQEGDAGQLALEQQKLEQEFTLKREMMDREFELKREQMQQEIALKREQSAAEVSLKNQQAAEQAKNDRINTIHNTPKENV